MNQSAFDQQRRILTDGLRPHFEDVVRAGHAEPAAMVGALMLIAGIISIEHDLEDVIPHIMADVERDVDDYLKGARNG